MIHEGSHLPSCVPNLGCQGYVSTSSGRVQWGDVRQGLAQAHYLFEDRYDVAMAHSEHILTGVLPWRKVEPTGRISGWTATQGTSRCATVWQVAASQTQDTVIL